MASVQTPMFADLDEPAPKPKRRGRTGAKRDAGGKFAKAAPLTTTDRVRLGKQHKAILERLRQGPATNVELSKIGLRFGGRIHELRSNGYTIEKTKGDGGIWNYTLKE